jgi:hypothetical protein
VAVICDERGFRVLPNHDRPGRTRARQALDIATRAGLTPSEVLVDHWNDPQGRPVVWRTPTGDWFAACNGPRSFFETEIDALLAYAASPLTLPGGAVPSPSPDAAIEAPASTPSIDLCTRASPCDRRREEDHALGGELPCWALLWCDGEGRWQLHDVQWDEDRGMTICPDEVLPVAFCPCCGGDLGGAPC